MSNYKELKPLFHKDRDAYEEEYQRRFNSSDTLRFDFYIGDSQAFLMQTAELWSVVTEIHEYNEEIIKKMYRNNGLPGKALEQFKRKCLIDEVIISNSIEGVISTRKEINAVLERVKNSGNAKRFESIVRKYNLLDTENSIPLKDSKDLRSLYDEILLDEIVLENPENALDGKLFRKDRVSIIGRIAGETIHEGVYPEKRIIESINEALSILADESINVLFRIGIFHYLFGYIHPFYDGNGRINRYISSYILTKRTNELSGYILSKAISNSIEKYYRAFKKTNDARNKGDLTPFVLDLLEILRDGFGELENELRFRLDEFNVYTIMLSGRTKEMDQKTRDLYYLLLQASLFSEMGISMEELVSFFSVTRVTMANRLKQIDEADMLIVNTSGHYKYYSLNLDRFQRKV